MKEKYTFIDENGDRIGFTAKDNTDAIKFMEVFHPYDPETTNLCLNLTTREFHLIQVKK